MSARRLHTTPTALLDPIEKASRDEITALQTMRLKATLNNVYKKCGATGRLLTQQVFVPAT